MTHTYQISGMTCTGCQAKVQHLLSQVKGVNKVTIDLAKGEAAIEMKEYIPTTILKVALTDYPKYQLAEKVMDTPFTNTDISEEERSWLATYKPLLLIVLFIFGVSLLTAVKDNKINSLLLMNNFMAGFFIVFSFFKLLNLSNFADSYAMYDIIAKRSKAYSFIYPFIELALGIAYLIHFNPTLTTIVTIILMSISAIGVIQSVSNKRKIRCACLGAVFNLPMSTITIVEDVLMIVMAAVMLTTTV